MFRTRGCRAGRMHPCGVLPQPRLRGSFGGVLLHQVACPARACRTMGTHFLASRRPNACMHDPESRVCRQHRSLAQRGGGVCTGATAANSARSPEVAARPSGGRCRRSTHHSTPHRRDHHSADCERDMYPHLHLLPNACFPCIPPHMCICSSGNAAAATLCRCTAIDCLHSKLLAECSRSTQHAAQPPPSPAQSTHAASRRARPGGTLATCWI